jgi:hypothetical protein
MANPSGGSTQAFLTVINVLQGCLEGAVALFSAALQPGRFPSRDDRQDDVEPDQTLGGFFAPIDAKGNPDEAKNILGFARLLAQACRVFSLNPLFKCAVMRAQSDSLPLHLNEKSLSLMALTLAKRDSVVRWAWHGMPRYWACACFCSPP